MPFWDTLLQPRMSHAVVENLAPAGSLLGEPVMPDTQETA